MLGAQDAAGAGLVLDDHRLPEFHGQPRRHRTADDVGHTPWRERDHQVQGARRERLREARGAGKAQQRRDGKTAEGAAIGDGSGHGNLSRA
jgi:hypothetical protein